jgi:hypothetical protein
MNKILSDAISTFGVEMQTIKAMEECGELIQALSRTLLGANNGDNVREEIADVEIMCEQLRMIYDTQKSDGDVDSIKAWKIARLEETIEACRSIGTNDRDY